MNNMDDRHRHIFDSRDCRALLMDPSLPIPGDEQLRRIGSFTRDDFIKVGCLILDNLQTLCHLTPHHTVFDLGCGWGRLALPLMRYLAGDGHYIGIDVAEDAIHWCRNMIGRHHNNFSFWHTDIYNSYANTSGTKSARTANFVPLGKFDVVVASSLFTHMLSGDMEHYLSQIAAVCAPGSVLYATYFLLDDEVEQLCRDGGSRHVFPYHRGPARLSNEAVPEDAVAYPLHYVVECLAAHGFDARIQRGGWSGRPGGFDYQDVVVAHKV